MAGKFGVMPDKAIWLTRALQNQVLDSSLTWLGTSFGYANQRELPSPSPETYMVSHVLEWICCGYDMSWLPESF